MRIGIVGLGLIGGSLARAYKEYSDNEVYGCDIDKSIVDIAKMANVIDKELTDDNIGECDCIIIALYPKAAVEYIQHVAPLIAKDAILIDCCGTKREICKLCFEIAEQHDFLFVGGHPMAGRQYSGFKHSKADLFKNASMVIIPYSLTDIRVLERIKKCIEPVGFSKITITTPEKHDEVIAFTSQMAHVVSNAYVKSETALAHKGFSAGSYKDLTRVAYLNEDMWTELFMENRDNLINELDYFIKEVTKYKEALVNEDAETLKKLLAEGKQRKEEIDG